MKVESWRRPSIRLNGLHDGRVVGKERVRRAHTDTRRCRGAIGFHGKIGERVTHPVQEMIGVDRLPRFRPGAGEPELERQLARRHLPDVGVHSVCIRARKSQEHGAVRRGGELSLGRARKAESTHLAVEWQCARAGNLRQPARRRHRLKVQLKKPVARDHVPQRAVGVLLIGGEDVRHGAIVVHDVHRRVERRHVARCAAWQRCGARE